MTDRDWEKCPYQKFFDEHAKRRRDKIHDKTEWESTSSQHSSPQRSPQTSDTAASASSPAFVYMHDSMVNSALSLSSPPSSIAGTDSPRSKPPIRLDLPSPSQGPLLISKDFATDLESPLIGGFCEEPEELDVALDARGRPKLSVMTTFRGGF